MTWPFLSCPGDVCSQLSPQTSHTVEHSPVFHINLLTPYHKQQCMGPTISAHLPIWSIMKKNMRLRRFWTLHNLAGANNCSIWSNGRGTLTWTTCGLIRMMSTQMIKCRPLKDLNPKPRHIQGLSKVTRYPILPHLLQAPPLPPASHPIYCQ